MSTVSPEQYAEGLFRDRVAKVLTADESWGTRRAFVYAIGVVGNETPIKIGVSTDVVRRLSALQIASPVELEWLCSYEVRGWGRAAEIEALCHSYFSHLRRHGEWFNVRFDVASSWIEKTFGRVIRSIDRRPISQQAISRDQAVTGAKP